MTALPRLPLARRGDRGYVLLIVVIVTAVLTSAVLAFHQTVRTAAGVAARQADRVAVRSAARSAIEVARAVLQEDDAKLDALSESWAKGIAADLGGGLDVVAEIRDAERSFPLGSVFGGAGELEPVAVGRLDRLLTLAGARPTEVRALNAALLERWRYGTSGGGASGAALEFLGELPLLRPRYGLEAPGGEGSAAESAPGLGAMAEKWLTLRGNERINVNTAPREVLLCLSEAMPEAWVEALLQERDKQPFAAVSAVFDRVSTTPELRGSIANLLTVQSTAFHLSVVARTEEVAAGLEAWFTRSGTVRLVAARWRQAR
ncbi:MAG: general secretion pathway protein GspK [Candidatus Schekmanbacteria bacterium]|nr:general secretion pathway protein GspK [Candidatus Schekmanbacteria bacterium]